MSDFYGSRVTISEPVKFTGNPNEDPENEEWFQVWKRALESVYQPERSKREDSLFFQIPDSKAKELLQKSWDEIEEMRCSEHCGNTVRDK